MIISEQYKNKLTRLAGLLKESVQFKATTGRSEEGTLSWYCEEYILTLAEQIVNTLDFEVSKIDNYILEISKSSTKIASNTFATKLNIKKADNSIQTAEFLLTISVNFEQNSNTTASVTVKGVTNKFAMNSKHSASDLYDLKNQVVTSFLNSFALIQKG